MPSQMCRLPMPLPITHPLYHHRSCLLNCALVTLWMVFFLFSFCFAFVDAATNYVYQRWFSEVFPNPYSNVLLTVVFNTGLHRARLSPAFSVCFQPLPLHAQILWIKHVKIPTCLAVVCWETEMLRLCMLLNLTCLCLWMLMSLSYSVVQS